MSHGQNAEKDYKIKVGNNLIGSVVRSNIWEKHWQKNCIYKETERNRTHGMPANIRDNVFCRVVDYPK